MKKIFFLLAILLIVSQSCMSQIKINELPASTSIDAADVIPFVDVSADTTKKITYANFRGLDTLTISWGIMDTTTTGDLPGWKVPFDITIIEISSFTDANTVTFNIEERAEATPNVAGTDAMTADQVADTNQQETTTFTNAVFSKNTWAVPTISATGDVALFSITMKYVKVYN